MNEKINEAIKRSGLKKKWIAEQLDITYNSLNEKYQSLLKQNIKVKKEEVKQEIKKEGRNHSSRFLPTLFFRHFFTTIRTTFSQRITSVIRRSFSSSASK